MGWFLFGGEERYGAIPASGKDWEPASPLPAPRARAKLRPCAGSRTATGSAGVSAPGGERQRPDRAGVRTREPAGGPAGRLAGGRRAREPVRGGVQGGEGWTLPCADGRAGAGADRRPTWICAERMPATWSSSTCGRDERGPTRYSAMNALMATLALRFGEHDYKQCFATTDPSLATVCPPQSARSGKQTMPRPCGTRPWMVPERPLIAVLRQLRSGLPHPAPSGP